MQILGRHVMSMMTSAAALLLVGCTAGQIVDSEFSPFAVDNGSFKFVGVDATGKPTGTEYVYGFLGDRSSDAADVVFDYFAPDTSTQLTGIRNSRQSIGEGRYYVDLIISPDTSGSGGGSGNRAGEYRSGIFDHEYSGTCNDYYTGKTDPYCVQYYFQIPSLFASCGSGSPCCRGDEGCVAPTPLPTHTGVKVITLY
jgi:hypothetical protein